MCLLSGFRHSTNNAICCSVLTGADITTKLVSAFVLKQAKTTGSGLFRKKREDESETVEEEEDEEVLSLYSYVSSIFSAASQTDTNSAVV